ncbi:MAG: phospholipase D-like domain-containing protein [Nanoarchaeota archaeon]|nr:phospholipase D-like domain-containing protein [Nanoarchaeota archaeon]
MRWLIFLVVLAGCVVSLPEEQGGIDVFFCPQDDCYGQVFDLVVQASVVECALYRVNGPLVGVLEDKGGVVIMDGESKVGPRGAVKRRDGGLMHNKFCVLDGATVFMGSFNVLENNPNRDNLLVIRSRLLADNFHQEFVELSKKNFGAGASVDTPVVVLSGSLIENYFCPEDDCEERLLDLLLSANSSIRFMTYSFTSDKIGSLLVEKHAEGVVVEGILDGGQAGKWSELKLFESAGIPVVVDDEKGDLHHKVFIVDDAVVWTGSYNPTKNGNGHNDENVVVVHDVAVAAAFIAEFDRLRGSVE